MNHLLQESPIYSDLGADERLCDLVEMFVEEMPERVGALTQAFDAKNSEELGRLAHQMKGSAGSYGFHQLTVPATRLEDAITDGKAWERVEEALAEITNFCGRLRAGAPQ